MKKIAIYGAGGLGKEVKTIIDAINRIKYSYDFIGFFDDKACGNDIIGDLDKLNQWPKRLFLVVGVGSPMVRKKIVNSITNIKVQYETLIHPSAIIGDVYNVSLGRGTIIGAGSILTTDIEIGEHVLINLNVTVGHDAKIGSFSSIMPGVNIAGGVNIDKTVLIGSGANLINVIKVGENATIGAGAVVIKDIRPHTTAIGIPAKEKR